jgi:hypothetical protein
MLNPSFEDSVFDTSLRLQPRLWWFPEWWRDEPKAFGRYCCNTWSMDGKLSFGMFNRINYAVNAGDYHTFCTYADLTGVGAVEFDVFLTACPSGEFAHFEASLLIDGEPLWAETAAGVHLDQQVSVGDLPGWHIIEIRITALEAGTFPTAYWTLWDNFRLLEGPTEIPAAIDLDPGTLNPRSNGKWITCYIELAEGSDAGAINGSTVTLDDIPAYISDKQGWATPEGNDENVADYDSDGVLERMVKFDRAAVQSIVEPPEATLTIKGWLTGGTPFAGTATLCVLDKDVKGK